MHPIAHKTSAIAIPIPPLAFDFANVNDNVAFEAECVLAFERARKADDALEKFIVGDMKPFVTEAFVGVKRSAMSHSLELRGNLRRSMQFLVSLAITPTLHSEKALAAVHKYAAQVESFVAGLDVNEGSIQDAFA